MGMTTYARAHKRCSKVRNTARNAANRISFRNRLLSLAGGDKYPLECPLCHLGLSRNRFQICKHLKTHANAGEITPAEISPLSVYLRTYGHATTVSYEGRVWHFVHKEDQ